MSATAVAVKAPVQENGNIYVPVSVNAVRLHTVPRFDLYFKPSADKPVVLYRERNTAHTPEGQDRLRESRVGQLYIPRAQLHEYNLYLTDHLDAILSDSHIELPERASILYDSAQSTVEEILSSPASRETVQRGKTVMRHAVNHIRDPDFSLEHLLRTISTDYYLYTHSVNVASYSVALALRFGFTDAATLREVANGALLHDVGEAGVDEVVRDKADPLTPEEWARLKEHPRMGYRDLEATGCLGEIALDIVLHHHEKLNGKGYPEGLQGDDISLFVRIVTVADIFDALTTDRSHRPGLSTFEALKLMRTEMRGELDENLLRIFIEMLGLRR